MDTREEGNPVEDAKNATQKTPGKTEKTAKVCGHLLTKGHSVKLHDGDIVVTCSEPGFRRAGLEHPHVKVHPEGTLTEQQLRSLRAEPKISVIEIGG